MRFWKNFKRKPIAAQIVVVLTVALLITFALPWSPLVSALVTTDFLGIPLGYLLVTLIFPIGMLILTSWFTSLMAEVEPFSEDHENNP